MPDPFQLSAQVNVAPSVQDFSALQSKMDALRSGGQSMQGTAQVDDGWGAVDQSLNIAPKMPVLPPVPRQQERVQPGPNSFYTGQVDRQYGIDSREGLTDYLKYATQTGIIQPMSGPNARRRSAEITELEPRRLQEPTPNARQVRQQQEMEQSRRNYYAAQSQPKRNWEMYPYIHQYTAKHGYLNGIGD